MTVMLKYSNTAGARGLFIVTTQGEVVGKLKKKKISSSLKINVTGSLGFSKSADAGSVEEVSSVMGALFGGWAGSLLFGVSLVKMPCLCFLVMVYNSISKKKHSCFIVWQL